MCLHTSCARLSHKVEATTLCLAHVSDPSVQGLPNGLIAAYIASLAEEPIILLSLLSASRLSLPRFPGV